MYYTIFTLNSNEFVIIEIILGTTNMITFFIIVF